MGWWISDLLAQDPMLLLSWIVWVIGSIVLHELAHGWAALSQGDDTPRATGHLTWNPLVHMGGMSLLTFALVGIAWGAMPVNPSRFKGRYSDALVALAGPAMNLLLAAIAIIAGSLWSGYAQGIDNPLWRNMMVFWIAGAFLNISLALFNLIPVPPLDGGRILANLIPAYRDLVRNPNFSMMAMVIILILMFQGGSYVFGFGMSAAKTGFQMVMSVLPGAKPYTAAQKHEEVLQDALSPRATDELLR